MKLINQVLRGVVIGVANIIPGVSGGTMMVSMGIYDTLIHCITHLFSEFRQSVKTLLPYAVGMLLGIVALASLLKFLFANYPLPTSTTFIGLILGGLNPLLAKIRHKKLGGVSIGVFVLFFAGIIAMALTGDVSNPDTITVDVGQMVILLVMGAVAAATMIIPGVSGSMVLMLLGYYHPVLNAVDTLKNAVLGLDFAAMGGPVLMLAPLIEWLLSRFPTQTYCAVLGLVVASPVAILLRTDMTGVSWLMILISLVTFALGFAAAMALARGSAGAEEPRA